MIRKLAFLFALTAAFPAAAQTQYEPPEGCEALATLRLPGCLVRQISECPAGNVVDSFQEGGYVGRAFYGHPSLFLRFEGADGSVSGHDYGTGAPDRNATLYPGSRYTYDREVYRRPVAPEPGDSGTETLDVGQEMTVQIGERRLRVLDLRFEVASEDYLYRERALLLRDPPLTLGVIGQVTDGEGSVTDEFSTIPEEISLAGEPGFLSFDPAVSCLPSS